MRTFELGDVIAERCLTFEADAGWSREVWIKIGCPRADPLDEGRSWLCPYQVTGLKRDRVFAIFGVDAMQALTLALHSIPAELAVFVRRLGGRFIYLGDLEASFLRACRACVETVGDVFPQELPPPQKRNHTPPEQFFVNVDLDVETELDLEPLVRALDPYAYSLERPPGRASFELNAPAAPKTPEPLIREFVRLIRLLPPTARTVWDRASRRTLDIGIHSRRRPYSETHSVTPRTLSEIADIGAELAFTVYSLDDEHGQNVAG